MYCCKANFFETFRSKTDSKNWTFLHFEYEFVSHNVALWRFVIQNRLLLMPKLSKEHKGSCVFGHGLPRISSLHLTSLWRHELYKFSDGDKGCLTTTRCCHCLHNQHWSAHWPVPLHHVSICIKANSGGQQIKPNFLHVCPDPATPN